MFSFRRKSKKEPEGPVIRTSPSLPTLNSQGIPWPEDLVDIAAIRNTTLPGDDDTNDETQQQEEPLTPSSKAAKISLQAERGPAIPFHKPFRPSESSSAGQPQDGSSISALYMTAGGPPSFEPKKTAKNVSAAGRYSQRRARIPPTFNLMVVGGKGTGKTSLLRLLLETADISPTATVDQKAALDGFLKGATKSTQGISTACVEICESRFDRILFSVIDTPGLDFQEGRELRLERQVSAVIKYLDAQYADTMSEESKVVRQSKGDQHIHLCIYMIDPASVTAAEERRGPQSGFPTKTRSETTVSQSNVPDLVPDTSSDDDEDDDSVENANNNSEGATQEVLSLSPAEIRVIRRISARANVLPVIARSDSLTDEKLQAVKKAVLTGLSQAGIDFGVFSPHGNAFAEPESAVSPKRKTKFAAPNGNGNSVSGHNDSKAESEKPSSSTTDNETTNGHASGGEDGSGGEEEEERVSRPVIKLRPKRHARPLSRSRSRRDLSQVAEDERRPVSPDDRDSVANVRFSAHIVANDAMLSQLPFALIAPEPGRHRQRASSVANNNDREISPLPPLSETGSEVNVPETPASLSRSIKNVPFLGGPPEDLKGVFVRKYRWGTIDVLDPNHCDFAAMRTAILSTHLKLLKIRTKEVLYEKYRTEKLLARRATAQISEEQRQRLIEDLGL